MTSRLKHVNPLQLGIVCCVLYFLIAFIPMVILMLAVGAVPPALTGGAAMSPMSFIFIPFAYGIGGFLGGLLMGWLYNVVAGWTGGIEIRLESVAVPLEAPL